MSEPWCVPLVEASDDVASSARRRSASATRSATACRCRRASRSRAPVVEAVAAGDEDDDRARCRAAAATCATPLAVRSSAVDEDGEDASFAGQHLTLLNVPSIDDVPRRAARDLVVGELRLRDHLPPARRAVHPPERRRGRAVAARPRQSAGVMFTQNPVTGADERVIEASWGLGEAVVAGLVIPDTFRVARDGEVLERTPGLKRIAIRCRCPTAAPYEEDIDAGARRSAHPRRRPARAAQPRSPGTARRSTATARDIEWAVADGTLYLLQCRAVTTTSASRPPSTRRPRCRSDPADVLHQRAVVRRASATTRSSGSRRCSRRAGSRRARRDPGGLGRRGVLRDRLRRGDASRSGGDEVATLGAGDHFGEIALIDEGARSATVTATTDLVCHGLTYWEFRPLVQENGAIGWKLLQTMARMLRAAEETPA